MCPMWVRFCKACLLCAHGKIIFFVNIISGTIMILCFEWMHTGEKYSHLQMGKRCQVTEGAFRNTGNVIAMEGSEVEAEVRRLTPGDASEQGILSRCPSWPGTRWLCSELTASSSYHLLHGRCADASMPSSAVGAWGKEEDGLLHWTSLGESQKSVPFSCGTLGK